MKRVLVVPYMNQWVANGTRIAKYPWCKHGHVSHVISTNTNEEDS